jgi:hypothetical protein
MHDAIPLPREVNVSMTVQQHFPSLRALQVNDERPIAEELRLVATKQQLAVVRTLADELERCLMRGDAAPALHEQFAQELARLGCRSLETAAAIAEKPVDVAEQSGLHSVLAVVDS